MANKHHSLLRQLILHPELGVNTAFKAFLHAEGAGQEATGQFAHQTRTSVTCDLKISPAFCRVLPTKRRTDHTLPNRGLRIITPKKVMIKEPETDQKTTDVCRRHALIDLGLKSEVRGRGSIRRRTTNTNQSKLAWSGLMRNGCMRWKVRR
jgi:hypothetical protein